MKKKRVLALIIAISVMAVAVGFTAFFYEREKRFSGSEKNSFAMGTIVSQKVYAPYAAKHIEKANKLISSLEDVISRNIESSATSTLNSEKTVSSALVAQALSQCEKISKKSDGAFDVTVGQVMDLWDFDAENPKVPDSSELEKALSQVGYENISIEGEKLILNSDAKIDLGAVGKGMACDSVISLYKSIEDCSGAVVSVGGSIGCFGKYNKAGDKWRIAVRHPRQENSFLGVITLDEGFVSTSGDYEKYFIENEERYHHILDARTGYPASSGLISVTVVCDSGFLSDALSTACFILGKDKSIELLEEYSASAIFVDEDMTVTTVGEIEFEKQ